MNAYSADVHLFHIGAVATPILISIPSRIALSLLVWESTGPKVFVILASLMFSLAWLKAFQMFEYPLSSR